jgi:hypothetical protein
MPGAGPFGHLAYLVCLVLALAENPPLATHNGD